MLTVRCPACLAAYQIEADKLGSGRKLKCAKCGTIWLATPEIENPQPVVEIPVEAPQPEPVSGTLAAGLTEEQAPFAPGDEEYVSSPSLESVVQARPGGLKVWWQRHQWMIGGMAFVTVGLLMGAVVVMKHWGAPDEPVDSHAGAEVIEDAKREIKLVQPPEGVVLRRVRSEVSPTETGVMLTVRGLVTNTTSSTLMVPPLLLQLLGKDGAVQDMWPVSSVGGELPAQGENAWSVSLTEPTLEAVQGWRVIFVEPTARHDDAAPVADEASPTQP